MTARGRRSGKPVVKVIEVDGLEVRVTRKSIKNAYLRVEAPSGAVAVSAPLFMSDDLVASFVRKKRAWIDSRRRDLLQTEQPDTPTGFPQPPRLKAAEASLSEQAEWKTVVSACAPLLVAKWEPVLGVKAGKLAYRNMKSRWGSCQPSTGRICINTRLALYPPECLEYVVVHELCHLKVSGHNAKFWALVESALPHWRDAREKLRR